MTKLLVNLDGFLADSHSVGDWNGAEKLAAENINRIYRAVYAAAPEDMDADLLSDILHRVWDDWGSRPGLLDVTDEEIFKYAERVI